MKKTRCFIILFVCILLFSACSANANDNTGKQNNGNTPMPTNSPTPTPLPEPFEIRTAYLTYEIKDGEAEVDYFYWRTEKAPKDLELEIPSTIKGYPVTKIGNGCFNGCKYVKSVVIPDSVTEIGHSAFAQCTVSKIEIPDSVVSIGPSAFIECQLLKEIVIPDSVKSIGASAFSYCKNLKTIDIGEGVEEIGTNAFYQTAWLTTQKESNGLVIVNSVLVDGRSYKKRKLNIPSYVKSICGNAFFNNRYIEEIVFPNGLEEIGEYAFKNCEDITEITLHEGLVSIGEEAFAGCDNLFSINLPDSVEFIGTSAFWDTAWEKSVEWKKLRTLSNIIVSAGAVSGEVKVNSKITGIAGSAFSSKEEITSIVLPEGMTYIGDNAFNYCSNLESVNIPDSVTSIGKYAFWRCNLSSIDIPDRVEYIGECAFDEGVTLIVSKDSYAETWAKENDRRYKYR